MRVFAVIPAYNEGDSLVTVVEGVGRHVPRAQIIVVDDGSRPTLARSRFGGARVLRHRINLGKGMALKTGCEYAMSLGADAIVLLDGDGQHEPAEIPRLLSALTDADIVFAARKLNREMPPVRLVGNWVLNRTASWLFRLDLKDIWCGFRAFRGQVFSKISWDAHDYAVDVEMAVRAYRGGLKSREIQIGTLYHDAHKGVTVLDGLRLLGRLLGWRFTL